SPGPGRNRARDVLSEGKDRRAGNEEGMRRWTVLLRHYRRRLRRPRWDGLPPILLAVGAGWLLSAAGWPIPWMMGPLFSSLLLAAVTGREWAFPARLRILSQVILG